MDGRRISAIEVASGKHTKSELGNGPIDNLRTKQGHFHFHSFVSLPEGNFEISIARTNNSNVNLDNFKDSNE